MLSPAGAILTSLRCHVLKPCSEYIAAAVLQVRQTAFLFPET